MPLTITEALAEIKTINKRLATKRQSLLPYLARQDGVRDPLEKEGGSLAYITSERQAIFDLSLRIIALRRGIQHANDATIINFNETSRTISEWLTWRREVASGERDFLNLLRSHIEVVRNKARQSGSNLIVPGAAATAPTDFIININEAQLAKQIEALEETLGSLDGQLSLKNATVIIEE